MDKRHRSYTKAGELCTWLYTWSAYETKFCPTIYWLHCKDHLKSQDKLFYRISLTLFLLEIFNFIRYANYTSYDITVHNNFSSICNMIGFVGNLQRDWYILHKIADTKRLIVDYIGTAQFYLFLIVICYKIDNLKVTHYAQWCHKLCNVHIE